MAAATATLTTVTSASAPVVVPVASQGIQATGSSLSIYGFQLDWMVVALIVILVGIIWVLYRAQRDSSNQLDLLDLVMENGRLSRTACVLVGSFGLTSWMMVTLTLNGKMTEGIFGLYSAAWIAPTVTRMIVGPAVPPAPKP